MERVMPAGRGVTFVKTDRFDMVEWLYVRGYGLDKECSW